MSEVQARLRAALVAIAEENVDWLYRNTIEDAIATLDDGIRPEEDAQGTVSGACAAVGRLDLLVEARALGYPWNAKTCANAARYGHLECLKYAHEQGCPWDVWTCRDAASNGQLECLKYLYEHGCPWDEETCRYAAMHGHLECLKYAHEHGCPWDENTCYNAAKNGHLECLKYACAHGCPGSAPYVKALKEVVLPDADERFVVEVALVFHRSGEISMREFLPLWAEHRMFYRKAHYEAVRKFHASLRLNR